MMYIYLLIDPTKKITGERRTHHLGGLQINTPAAANRFVFGLQTSHRVAKEEGQDSHSVKHQNRMGAVGLQIQSRCETSGSGTRNGGWMLGVRRRGFCCCWELVFRRNWGQGHRFVATKQGVISSQPGEFQPQ